MKILIVSQYFWPEEFRINDLALNLVEHGYQVTVLTGNPNYPKGKFYQGYGFKFLFENYHGIKVYRVPIISRGNASGFRLVLNYLSFAIDGSLLAMFLGKTYDVSLVYAISPITAAYPSMIHKLLYNSKLNLWVQDLWPESVSSAGKISFPFITNLLSKMVKHIYSKSDNVLVQSEGFIQSVEEKGVKKKQLKYIPNWAEDVFSDNSKIKIEKFRNIIPKGFNIMFAGNIGEAQDFESIIKVIERTKMYQEINWIIIGDGRKKTWLESEIIRLGLQKNTYLLGRYPLEDMPSFFVHADIMLLSLKSDDIFSRTIPSKLQSYMAFGKPIVGMLNGISADIIRKANCGCTCDAGDYIALTDIIIKAYQQNTKVLINKGINGKKYYNSYFSKEVIIDKLIKLFQE